MTKIIPYLVGLGIAAAIGFAGGSASRTAERTIPNNEIVQQGYIAPKSLEILCYDHDSNNVPETEVRIGESRYLLREVDGKPILSRFLIWHGSRPRGDGTYEQFPSWIELEHVP